MDEQRNSQSALTPAVKDARREISDVMRASPFEPVKFQAALQKLADTEHNLRNGTAAVTSQLVGKLTDPERNDLERMLRKMTAFTDDGKEPGPAATP